MPKLIANPVNSSSPEHKLPKERNAGRRIPSSDDVRYRSKAYGISYSIKAYKV